MPGSGRQQDRVARPDPGVPAVDLHLALALEDVVDLLGAGVVVALGRLPRCEGRLGEALLARASKLGVEQNADRAPVGGRERRRPRA